MEWSDERAELRLLKDSPNANDWRVRAQISLLDRAYPASTLAKALVRKVKRKMVGVDHRIEPAAIFGIVVFDRPELEGGGGSFGQDYPRVLREIGLGQCDRAFEFCAGPGYIGYSLLAHGFCKQLVLADVNPAAVEAARMTAKFNEIEHLATIYLSDGLSAIPADERWDLVVGNPPHFETWRGDSKLRHEDVGWDLHRKFYSGVKSHLKPGASAVLQENQLGSSPDIFEPMIRGGGGTVIGTLPGPDLGLGGRIYYLHSRWD